MKTLVTGGLGFLGSAIVRSLVKKGREVRILDKSGIGGHGNSRLHEQFGSTDKLELFEADIRDEKAVNEAVKGCDSVFNVAALISFWSKQKKEQWDINVNGTKNLMHACLKNEVKKVVHTSTVNALGFPSDENQTASEKSPFNWQKYNLGYMDSKNAADKIIGNMVINNNLPAVIVHPGTIFGGGNLKNPLNASTYLINIEKGKLLFYPGGGTSCVGLTDVVNGHLLAEENGKIGEQYILSGENLTYKKIFEIIAELVKVKPPKRKLPVWLGLLIGDLLVSYSEITGEPPLITPEIIKIGEKFNFYSSEKAQRELGYTYRPFSEVLSDTWQSIREQRLLS